MAGIRNRAAFEMTVPDTVQNPAQVLAIFGILIYRYIGSETISFEFVGAEDGATARTPATVEIDFSDDPIVKDVFFRVEESRLDVPWSDLKSMICRVPQNMARALAGSCADEGTVEVHWSADGRLSFSSPGWSEATITPLRDHFAALVSESAKFGDQRASRLSMLSLDERDRLLKASTDGFKTFDATTIPKAFEARVDSSPNAIALSSIGVNVTYQDLYGRAKRIALSLQRRSIHVETIVGVCLDEPLTAASTYLGVLIAGGIVMALDHEWPRGVAQERIRQAKPAFVITNDVCASTITSDSLLVVAVESLEQSAEGVFVPPALTPDNAAYIIYTSGSTGVPKGIIGLHRTITNAQHTAPPIDGTEVFAQSADLAFGAGFIGLLFALLRGARLVLVSRSVMRDVPALWRLWKLEEVTRLVLVPPQLKQLALLDREEIATLTSIRSVALAGAALTPDVLRSAYTMFPQARLTNGYTCLEVGTMSTRWETTPETRERELSIGKPLSNIRIYLMGPRMNLLPWGMPGEIFIGSPDLSRGYVNQPERTREHFLENPFLESGGERVYRTGDIGRLLPNGELQYVGRVDHQAKIRGIRIEVEEIEFFLHQVPAVYQAAVVTSEGPVDVRLIAYVSCKPGQQVSISALREHLRTRLPAYMLPSLFAVCDHLPVTPNGKLDRKALPPLETRPELDTVHVPPQNEVELAVKNIWESSLGIHGIGVKDHFLEIGGDSLFAVQIAIRLQDHFGCGLPVASLLQFPTIQELAAEITAHSGNPT